MSCSTMNLQLKLSIYLIKNKRNIKQIYILDTTYTTLQLFLEKSYFLVLLALIVRVLIVVTVESLMVVTIRILMVVIDRILMVTVTGGISMVTVGVYLLISK